VIVKPLNGIQTCWDSLPLKKTTHYHKHEWQINIDSTIFKYMRNIIYELPRYNWNIVESGIKHQLWLFCPKNGLWPIDSTFLASRTPLSTIFQLYRGMQFHWRSYHNILYIDCCMTLKPSRQQNSMIFNQQVIKQGFYKTSICTPTGSSKGGN
jgi:hypothetical protein